MSGKIFILYLFRYLYFHPLHFNSPGPRCLVQNVFHEMANHLPLGQNLCQRLQYRAGVDHEKVYIFCIFLHPFLGYLSSEDIPQAGGYQEVGGVHVGPDIAHSCQGVGHLVIKVIKVIKVMMIMMM